MTVTMKFVYTPEGLEPREWPFEPAKLMTPEAEAIEKATGLYLPQWQDAAAEGSQRAMRAFLWVMLRRKTPTLKFDEVQVAAGEMSIEFTDDELGAILADLTAKAEAGTLSDEQLDALEGTAEQWRARHGGEDWQPPAPEQDDAELGIDGGTDEGEQEDPKAETVG